MKENNMKNLIQNFTAETRDKKTNQVTGYVNLDITFDYNSGIANTWLTQEQLANLFNIGKSGISEHIKNIIDTEELEENSTIRDFRIVASNGKTYNVKHYNLEMIIALGFRVKSSVAVKFRKWANNVIKELLINGYVNLDCTTKKLINDNNQLTLNNNQLTLNNNQLTRDIKLLTSVSYKPMMRKLIVRIIDLKYKNMIEDNKPIDIRCLYTQAYSTLKDKVGYNIPTNSYELSQDNYKYYDEDFETYLYYPTVIHCLDKQFDLIPTLFQVVYDLYPQEYSIITKDIVIE